MAGLKELSELGICERCLGRTFASVGESMDNSHRGRMIYFSIRALEPDPPELPAPGDCPICRGIFGDFERYCNIVMDEIGDLEYDTFLIGSVFDPETVAMEGEIQERFGSRGESIKKEFNREFGKYFSDRTGKEASFTEPDLTLVVDTRYDYARAEIRSIFISGRYNKHRRDLPQTRWIHKAGNNESVEYYIGTPAIEMSGGENFFLHAAGREDVDVRMLGGGRDFVLEISSPRKRKLDLAELEERINSSGCGVSVRNLAMCQKGMVKEVKGSTFDKTYRVLLRADEDLHRERLEAALDNITGKVIYQRTPLRVAVRRADLVRERSIRESTIEHVSGKNASIVLRAESGTYIKELINGDDGRTKPSLSSEYGGSLAVAELDVVEINRGN